MNVLEKVSVTKTALGIARPPYKMVAFSNYFFFFFFNVSTVLKVVS